MLKCCEFNHPCACVLFSSQSEQDEFEKEYKQKYERERALRLEETKKLSSDVERVRALSIHHVQRMNQKHFLTLCFSISLSQLFCEMFISHIQKITLPYPQVTLLCPPSTRSPSIAKEITVQYPPHKHREME